MITYNNVSGFSKSEIAVLSKKFENRKPQDLIKWASDKFGDKFAIVTSFQAEGMVILDMAIKINPNIRVITIDTGRLHQENYSFMEEVKIVYNTDIEVYFPNTEDVQQMVTEKGVNLFYQNVQSRLTCCQVRKVNPLTKALKTVEAWMTGLRRDQSATRLETAKVSLDLDHDGLVKLNPLADWTHDEVWDYIYKNNVPRHTLYEQGYKSIGCAPCTRSIQPWEDHRAGRWWWEGNDRKECGIHCKL